MKAVSIINFKGGVSKTTLSFHLACYLAGFGKVLLIDVDHQSSLSLVILRTSWQPLATSGTTVNQIFQSFTNRRIAMPGNQIVVSNPMRRSIYQNFYPNLDLVPAQFELDDTEIDLASTSTGNPALSDWEKRTLLASWLDDIGADSTYDYVLFDCPPATKIVSQNALACSHGYIVPVIPDELSSRGVTHFANLVQNKIDQKLQMWCAAGQVPQAHIPRCYVPQTKMAAIVPSLVKTSGNAASKMTNIHTIQLAALRTQWKTAVINTVGKHYIAIPEALNAGWPVWNYWGQNARRDIKNMMSNICADLKTKIDAL